MSPRPSRLVPHGSTRPIPSDDLGFPSLLMEVARTALQQHSAVAAADHLLTYNGRTPLSMGISSLPVPALAAYSILRDHDVHLVPKRGMAATSWLFLCKDGRVSLTEPNTARSGSPAQDVVGIPINLFWSDDALALFQQKRLALQRQANEDLIEVREWLQSISADELKRVLTELHMACAHAAPLLLYVNESVYSNFRKNNLTGKVLLPSSEQSLFNQLPISARDRWSGDDAIFIYCAHLVMRSGGASRLEELNSTQLLPYRVAEYLARKAGQYRAFGGLNLDVTPPRGYEAKENRANILAANRAVMASRCLPYRRIWGLTLNKQENFLSPDVIRLSESEILPQIGLSIRDRWGHQVDSHTAWLLFLQDWVPLVVAGRIEVHQAIFANPFEELLHNIVQTIVAYTKADIGMTRGMRSLLSLSDALSRQVWQEVVDWELPYYYCCVVLSDRIVNDFAESPEQLADMLWAIAARMQYNAWHFIPGNLPVCDAVTQRDYFFPPTVPDISEWSDQHHRGHVVNGVRFAIRAPIPVTVGGRSFAGFADVRLMRIDGEAFSIHQLASAVVGSKLVGEALNALAVEVVQQRRNLQVTSFTSEWYAARAREAQKLLETSA
jgi:hypothetical protein